MPLVVIEKLLAFRNIVLGSEDFIVPAAFPITHIEPFNVSRALFWVIHRALKETGCT